MNREFFEKVRVEDDDDVVWLKTNINIINSYMFSCIWSFTENKNSLLQHPQKYYYSSGMNYPTAYKHIQ